MKQPLRFPLPIKFHKKTVQLELSFKPPYEELKAGRLEQNNGAIYFAMAKSLNPQGTQMDWNNKTLMKIGLTDIAKICVGLRMKKLPIDIVHKVQRDKTSSLTIEAGQKGTYKLSMFQKYEENTDARFTYQEMRPSAPSIIFDLGGGVVPRIFKRVFFAAQCIA